VDPQAGDPQAEQVNHQVGVIDDFEEAPMSMQLAKTAQRREGQGCTQQGNPAVEGVDPQEHA
jgi:hypothetical protein